MKKVASVEKSEVNLLSMAKNSGPQKFINRNDALARAGGTTVLPQDKKPNGPQG
jgi:hypothetical protein